MYISTKKDNANTHNTWENTTTTQKKEEEKQHQQKGGGESSTTQKGQGNGSTSLLTFYMGGEGPLRTSNFGRRCNFELRTWNFQVGVGRGGGGVRGVRRRGGANLNLDLRSRLVESTVYGFHGFKFKMQGSLYRYQIYTNSFHSHVFRLLLQSPSCPSWSCPCLAVPNIPENHIMEFFQKFETINFPDWDAIGKCLSVPWQSVMMQDVVLTGCCTPAPLLNPEITPDVCSLCGASCCTQVRPNRPD